MTRIVGSRREMPGLERGDREVAAAWVVLLLVAGIGLSLLSIHDYTADDGPSAVVMSRIPHDSLSAGDDWQDPACLKMLCGLTLSAPEREEARDQAGSGGDPTEAYSEPRGMRPDATVHAGTEPAKPLCS